MTGFYDWSTTAGSNANVGTINWAEGQAPSSVNDSSRAEMADVAAWRDFVSGAKTTSGTDTITLTSGCSITAYTDMMFIAKAGGTNTGAATINIDSLGTKAVELNGSALSAGDHTTGKHYLWVYDGTAFQITRLSVNALTASAIGVTVQGYDADTSKLDVAETRSASQNFSDNELIRPKIKDYGETVNAIGSIGGGTQDIDLESGNVVSGTVDTSTTTFTFSNPPASGTAGSFTLFLTNGGSQTVNWPASVDWAGGTAPSLTSSGVDILTFTTIDGGTIWYGFAAGLDMS